MRPGRWSVARQLLTLQVALLSVLVAAATAAVVVDARGEVQEAAREKVLAVAGSLAVSPFVVTAAAEPDPSLRLQPYAEQVRRRAEVDFVVFLAPDRTRWSHPDPALVGEPFIGTVAPALAGETFTETTVGTLGASVRAVAPVPRADGSVAGLVAVGITTRAIGADLAQDLRRLAAAAALLLAVAVLGAAVVSRRLRRQTHGMRAEEITRLYEYYDAVLHSVREGLLLLDRHRDVVLVNDEARRLLELPGDVAGHPVAGLPLPPSLAQLLAAGRAAGDELHLTGRRVLVVSQREASWEGEVLGTVVTMRDHTELQDLTDELGTVRALAETLRSQAHESANRLHTVVSLLELDRTQEAVAFATAEIESAQRLTDDVVAAVEEPVLAATLLGKAAQASERGVELVVTPDSEVSAGPGISPRDLVTVVGNLLDNAIDAAAEGAQPARVTVRVRQEGAALSICVADTGPGLDPGQARAAFQRGWSTKPATAAHGRGLGLALVGQVVHRLGGTIDVRNDGGAVFTAVLPLPAVLPQPGEAP